MYIKPITPHKDTLETELNKSLIHLFLVMFNYNLIKSLKDHGHDVSQENINEIYQCIEGQIPSNKLPSITAQGEKAYVGKNSEDSFIINQINSVWIHSYVLSCFKDHNLTNEFITSIFNKTYNDFFIQKYHKLTDINYINNISLSIRRTYTPNLHKSINYSQEQIHRAASALLKGGQTYKKTDQKKTIAGRERVIYVNSRRKQFIKMKGQFVAVSSLRP